VVATNSRGAGWEFVHICSDDASRISFCRMLSGERRQSAVAFHAAAGYY